MLPPLLALSAGSALADQPPGAPTAEARAQTLYDEAGELLAQTRFEEACTKLAESEALAPRVKTLQRLATCEEAEGKIARALAAYRELTLLAGRSLRGAKKRAVLARVQRLEASIPRLVVRLSPEALAIKDLEVKACGVELREGELGLPVPEDPGACEVSARAPGKAAWTKSLELGSRGGSTEIVVPALEAEAPAPAALTETAPPPEPPPEPAPPPPPPPPPTGPATERRVTGIVLVGLGAALAGSGAYFAYASMNSSKQANARCPSTTCSDPEGLSLRSDANTQMSLADLTLVAGGVALLAGVVVLATQPSRPTTSRAARIWLRPSPGGLAFGGVF